MMWALRQEARGEGAPYLGDQGIPFHGLPQSIQYPHVMTSHKEQVTKSALCTQCAFWCPSGGQAKLDNMSHLCEEMRSPLG